MKNILRFAAPLALLATPLLALAADAGHSGINTTYIKQYSDSVVWIINYLLVPLLMAVAFIVFLFGVYKYFILGAADEKDRTDGRQFTLWGIIGLVVILSIWGIVNLVMSTFGLSVGTAPAFPTIGSSGVVGGNTLTAAQTTALNNAYTAQQTACSGTNAGTAACTTATNAFEAAKVSVGGTSQVIAQQAYDACVSNGNTAAECLPAYTAYGGTGAPVGSNAVAQQGWSCSATRPCASDLVCAYDSNSDGNICQDAASASGCAAFTACTTTGGQTGTCDDIGNCISNSNATGETTALPLNASCSYGATPDLCDSGLTCQVSDIGSTGYTCQEPFSATSACLDQHSQAYCDCILAGTPECSE